MAQQTLLKPPRQAPRHRQAPLPQRKTAAHRKPQTRGVSWSRVPRRGHWTWPVVGLLVAFVLSLFAGVLLALHGPSGSSSSPSLTLTPTGPSAPSPAEARRVQGPVQIAEPAAPGPGLAKKSPVATKKVTLRPGDTLYMLAGSHGTTVKTLQRLNGLGTSTLIYAGDTLRLPVPTRQADRAKPAPPTNPAPSSGAKTSKKAGAVIAFARDQVGKPYIWGGTGPRGYDCSGLMMRAWGAAGVKLPRTTWSQVHAGKATTRAKLVPGDLVITNNGGHVQLYIGDGEVIHAPGSGRSVTVAPLTEPSQVVSYRHITP